MFVLLENVCVCLSAVDIVYMCADTVLCYNCFSHFM